MCVCLWSGPRVCILTAQSVCVCATQVARLFCVVSASQSVRLGQASESESTHWNVARQHLPLRFACPFLYKNLKACIQVGQLKFILKFKEIGAVDLNSFFADPDLVILDADPDPAYKNIIKKFKNKFLNYLKLYKTITHFCQIKI